MKKIIVITFFVITSKLAFSQVITDKELAQYKKEIWDESLKLRKELLQRDNVYSCDLETVVNFQIDTFLIERLQVRMESADQSTGGTTQSLYDLEAGYDKLLNKYYQMLLKKLNNDDKEILKQSQRNWILYRDSERKFNDEIAKEEYSGGGSMQLIFIAYHYADITKKRVFELFYYLNRISE